jgi:hypothetical protein
MNRVGRIAIVPPNPITDPNNLGNFGGGFGGKGSGGFDGREPLD